MANIQKRESKDGRVRYRAQVRLRGFPPQSETFDRKTDAKHWSQRIEAAIRDGKHFPDRQASRRTVAELVDRYLQALECRRLHSYPKQRQLLSWWSEKIGRYSLASVTPALIAEKRDELLAENIGTDKAPRRRSPATANRYLAALSKACSEAMREWHWLLDNPVRRVSKESESSGRVRFLSLEERDRLLQACEHSEVHELQLIVLLAVTTGMRRGEILGLRWDDVDLERGQAVLHNTKNRERRSVPLVAAVLELLRAHRRVRRIDSDLVFPGRKDRPISIDHAWYEALKLAEIQDFRFHDLRHTAASYLAMSGATSAEIAAVLGHKTLQMVKRYAHLSDAHTGAVIDRMTKKFFG
jgi:integrase